MFNIGPTPFDVRLVAFGIPIRVHPSFWIATTLLGWSANYPQVTFIWVICAFVSILIHELGHAVTATRFGWPTEILLYFGGGLAISDRYRNDTPGRSIAVSFMGPMAGFLFLLQIFIVEIVLARYGMLRNLFVRVAIADLWFINLYWGLVNLLPVYPLDGGQILYAVFRRMRLHDPIRTAMQIGAVVAGAAAFYFFQIGNQFAGVLFLMLCVQNVASFQSGR